jgi:flagellar motor switch protein FliG
MSEIISGNLYNKLANLLLFINAGDTQACTNILKSMNDEYSKKILDTIAETDTVDKGSINDIVDKFFSIAVDKETLYGGKQISSKLFQDTYGNLPDYVNQENNPFSFLQRINNKQLIEFFKKDTLQFNAMILNYLPKKQVVSLLKVYDEQTRSILSERMLSVKEVHPQIIKLYAQKLSDHFKDSKTQIRQEKDNQFVLLARSLESMGKEDREKILEFIERKDPRKAKKLAYYMFTFEDFVHIPSSELIKIVTRIRNMEYLGISLSGKSKSLIQKFKATLSERGKLRLDLDIKKAEQHQDEDEQIECRLKLIDIARELEEKRVIEPLHNYKGIELEDYDEKAVAEESPISVNDIPKFGESIADTTEGKSNFMDDDKGEETPKKKDNDSGFGQFSRKVLAPPKPVAVEPSVVEEEAEFDYDLDFDGLAALTEKIDESKVAEKIEFNETIETIETIEPEKLYKDSEASFINPDEIDAKGSLTEHLTTSVADPFPFKTVMGKDPIYEELHHEKENIELIDTHVQSNRFNDLIDIQDIVASTMTNPKSYIKKSANFKKLINPVPTLHTIEEKIIKRRTEDPGKKLVRKRGSKVLQSKKIEPKKEINNEKKNEKKKNSKELNAKIIRTKKRKK